MLPQAARPAGTGPREKHTAGTADARAGTGCQRGTTAMELFDDGGDGECAEEAFSFSIVPRELRRRFWSETTWSAPLEARSESGDVLFADRSAEKELRAEMRLSQLWNRYRAGTVTIAEFGELSGLMAEVDGIRGALCTDCAALERPNVAANWALGDTMLCRGHLRFRLWHAESGGDDAA
jgi:hypothetical protein